MALRLRLMSLQWYRPMQYIVRTCTTSSSSSPTSETVTAADATAPTAAEDAKESATTEVSEIKDSETTDVAPKSREQLHYEAVQAAHKEFQSKNALDLHYEKYPWRSPEARAERDAEEDIRPPEDEDQSLIPIEERRPRASFPQRKGETPTASNFVVPIPPPPVPVDKYFRDRDLPAANAVTSAFEACSPIFDNKRDVPFQEWWLCEQGELGTPKRPIIVPSLYDKRIVTCMCAPLDSSIIYYILVHRGYMSRCANCGNCFVLMSEKNHEVRKGV